MRLYSAALVAIAFGTCSLCSPINVPVDVAGITVSAGLSLSGTLSIPTPTTTSSASGPISGAPVTYTAGAYATNGPYASYFSGYEPTNTMHQPQPIVSDWVRGKAFQLNLTNPETIPTQNLVDPVVLPPSRDHPNQQAEISQPGANFSTPESLASLSLAYSEISAIINSNVSKSGQCNSCIKSLQIASNLSFAFPWEIPSLLLKLCYTYTTSTYCASDYSINTSGGVYATLLQTANLTGLDGIMICSLLTPAAYCTIPPVSSYNASNYFNTTLPASRIAPAPGGKTTKVLHLSDVHLDPRYTVGSEAQCGSYLCCRPGKNNTSAAPGSVLSPAPRFGSFKCDTPYDLVIAAMEAIPVLTGTTETGFNFTIFTGDLISHDQDTALGRDYTDYEETMTFAIFKKFLGDGPTFSALGNHDSWPQALVPLNSLNPTYLSQALSWNFNHLASLWEHARWINADESEQVRTHYGAYSKLHTKGLRIITFNSDFIYRPNIYNYINMTDPDPSGTFKFVADELQRAENNGERVWVVAHVLSGWDGSAGLPNPTDLWSQIIDRYSPHVIAALFVGHIHDELFYINYADNSTVQSTETARAVTFVGPSLSPLTNLNSGFRMYEVDTVSFDVMESYTWYSDISKAPALDSQEEHGAVYQFEYSAREAYGQNITSNGVPWPNSAPLNATWWHKVTEQMEIEPSLVNTFNSHQGRLSIHSPNCTTQACVTAKVCYMRSSTYALGTSCPQGFSSVQSAFKGKQ